MIEYVVFTQKTMEGWDRGSIKKFSALDEAEKYYEEVLKDKPFYAKLYIEEVLKEESALDRQIETRIRNLGREK